MSSELPDSTESMFASQRGVPGQHQLKAGDRLAGRFVIVQFLARGGMGEVYEAADENLQGKHCALKTLRPEIAAQPVVRERFEREVLLAREVNHPNVCPTFDLFREETANGPLLFLTMKLLRGESLQERLHRLGSLGWEASLPIARQMAAALDAAHKAGVIHRDFKPGNVMLEGIGADVRVSITDFGLSRLYESDSTLAQTGRVSGTVGYIAPEVLQGRIASPTVDVYAFGVVLHEMVTGQRPQNQSGKAEVVRPGSLVGGLPRAWERVILGCLAYDPGKRFQSAGEAVLALEPGRSASRSVTVRKPLSRRRWIGLGAGAAAVSAGAVWLSAPKIEALLNPLPAHRMVALLAWPAEPNSPARPLLRVVLDAVGNRLSRAESSVKDFAVISPADAGQAPPKALGDVVGSLGANLVLAVSLRAPGPGHTLGLQVLAPGSGKVLRQRVLSFDDSELSGLAEKASVAAARLLDLPDAPAALKDQDELAKLSSAAYRVFSEAEDLRAQPNDSGLDAAIEKYQKVLEAEPRFAMGYAALSLAYAAKYQKAPDTALLQLAERNASLAVQYNPDSAKGVLAAALVDAQSGRVEKAIDGIGRALQLDPGNPRILLYKGGVFHDLARFRDEENVYREINRQRPNFWPAYNQLGGILFRQTRYQEAADAFGVAAAVSARVALPLANQGVAYVALEKDDKAEDAFRRSLERAPNEIAYSNLGSIAFKRGDYQKALEDYGKALDLNSKNFRTWRNVADCHKMLGNSKREAEALRKAEGILTDLLRVNPLSGTNWAAIAFCHARLGLRAEAEADLKNAETRGVDQRAQFMNAQTLAVLGRKEEALALVLKCIDQGLSVPDVELAPDLKEVRADPRYRRHLAEKGPGR